jgi:hypothetical protein
MISFVVPLVLTQVIQRECPDGRLEREFNIASYSPSCCDSDSSWVLKSSVAGAPFTLEGSFLTLAPATQPEKEMPTSAYLLEKNMKLVTRPYYLNADAESHVDAIDTMLTSEAGSGEGATHTPLPELGSEGWCRALATAQNMTFQSTASSNGAPAGCIKYNDGRIIYVAGCTGHANCGTLTCNGCEVMAISDALYPYVHVWYSNYPPSYPQGELGSTNFSIGANRNRGIYETFAHPDGAVIGRIYSDQCPTPPSPPPPPPIEALCVNGDWPLFPTEESANIASPVNKSHAKEHFHITYYMPESFPGATQAGPGVFCPAHATNHPPLLPPSPGHPPANPPPPPPGAPPSAPPPHRMHPAASALIVFLIPAAALVCLCVCLTSWCLYWRDPEIRARPLPKVQQASISLSVKSNSNNKPIASQVRFSQLVL